MEATKPRRANALRHRLAGAGRGFCGFTILLALPLAAFHLVWLLAALELRSALPALLAALLGVLAADAITGLVHWACDTWGDEQTPWFGPGLIYAFREHHRDPLAMLEHDWIEVNREPGMAATAALLILCLPDLQRVVAGHSAVYGFLCFFIAYAAAANQLHYWSHAERPPRLVRGLQHCALILTPERHARHHRAPNTSAYCISAGWLDPILDGIGFWRRLERGITRITGVEARAKVRVEAVE